MNDNSILWLELVVGVITSLTLLGIFVWGVKGGQFDDSKKMMDGLLFDSVEDLNEAIQQDEKVKELKENKKKQQNKEEKSID